MDAEEFLTMSEATQLAGITMQTMRVWANKEIQGAERLKNGSWKIPKHELMVLLTKKKPKQFSGAQKGGQSAKNMDIESDTGSKIEDLLKGQISRLEMELEKRERQLDEMRDELKESKSEVNRLNKELIAHLSGGSLIGQVSRWIKTGAKR